MHNKLSLEQRTGLIGFDYYFNNRAGNKNSDFCYLCLKPVVR